MNKSEVIDWLDEMGNSWEPEDGYPFLELKQWIINNNQLINYSKEDLMNRIKIIRGY